MTDKKVAVLGSTGSVGTQVLDVCEKLGARVSFIAANSNTELLEAQIRKFRPEYCAVSDEKSAELLKISTADTNTRIVSGYDNMCEAIGAHGCDIVYNAVSGKNGLLPTLAVLRSGKTLALANKESMVLAGPLVNKEAEKSGATILPVDSEHCAIFQCLKNGSDREVKRILLTASGGPFFGMSYSQLEGVTVEQTLAHPTWNMGKKITVDSATLANKGLEIIEAMHLFRVPYDKIKVLIHRQSIVHSMVEYKDNCIIAQMSVPDMRHPGQFALTYPERAEAVIPELDLTGAELTFAEPDLKAFRMLSLAQFCAQKGGVMPCVYNGSNEEAVAMFLNKEIGFNDIYRIVYMSVAKAEMKAGEDCEISTERILYFDQLSRRYAHEYKEKLKNK